MAEIACPACGKTYTPEEAESQGFMCIACGSFLEPSAGAAQAKPEQAPSAPSIPAAAEATATHWQCTACGAVYDVEAARAHGFLCPKDGAPLEERSGLPPWRDLATGLEIRGHRRAYRLEAYIGQGGQAVVWRAQPLSDPEGPVAVKIFRLAYEDRRFRRLLMVYERLEGVHCLVPLLDYGRISQRQAFLVFPYYPLGAVTPQVFRLPPEQVDWERLRGLVTCLTTALMEVHAREIIHRDVKPQNIFWERDEKGQERFLLGDFSIAAPDLLATLTVHMSQAYAAPEIFTVLERWRARNRPRTHAPITPAVDWWALGVTLLELVHENPFATGSALPTTFDRDAYLNALDLPDDWRTLLRGLLTRDPNARWTGRQVLDWLAGRTVPLAPTDAFAGALRLGEQVYHTWDAWARAAWENWDLALQALDSGEILRELVNFFPKWPRLARLFNDPHPERRLARILWTLNPRLPFGYQGRSFPDRDALFAFLEQPDDPVLLQEMRRLGLLSAYLESVGPENLYGFPTDETTLQNLRTWEERREIPGFLAIYLLDVVAFRAFLRQAANFLQEFHKEYLCVSEIQRRLEETRGYIARLRQANDPEALFRLYEGMRALEEAVAQRTCLSKKDVERFFARWEERARTQVPLEKEGFQHLVRVRAWQTTWKEEGALPAAFWQAWQSGVLKRMEKFWAEKAIPREVFVQRCREVLAIDLGAWYPLSPAGERLLQELRRLQAQDWSWLDQAAPWPWERIQQGLTLLAVGRQWRDLAKSGEIRPRKAAEQWLQNLHRQLRKAWRQNTLPSTQPLPCEVLQRIARASSIRQLRGQDVQVLYRHREEMERILRKDIPQRSWLYLSLQTFHVLLFGGIWLAGQIMAPESLSLYWLYAFPPLVGMLLGFFLSVRTRSRSLARVLGWWLTIAFLVSAWFALDGHLGVGEALALWWTQKLGAWLASWFGPWLSAPQAGYWFAGAFLGSWAATTIFFLRPGDTDDEEGGGCILVIALFLSVIFVPIVFLVLLFESLLSFAGTALPLLAAWMSFRGWETAARAVLTLGFLWVLFTTSPGRYLPQLCKEEDRA